MKDKRLFVLAAAFLILAGCSDSGNNGGSSSGSCEDSCPGGECIDNVCYFGDVPENTCSEDNPCKGSQICVDGKCVNPGEAGSSCGGDSDCTDGTCVDGTCTISVKAGQGCGTGFACDDDFDCKDGVCLKRVELGGDCRSSVTYCDGGTCNQGKCVPGSDVPSDCIDTDEDGISDEYDNCNDDSDNDGIVNCQDPDSDGDTIPDALEGFVMDACAAPADSDYDGYYDFLDTDSDNNGIPDNLECCGIYSDSADCQVSKDENGLFISCVDTDDDTIPDSSELDNDNDDTEDIQEIAGIAHSEYTDYGEKGPRGADCNNDTIPDSPGSADNPFDCDGDTIPDYLDPDSDNDTILDRYEATEDSNKDGYYDRYSLDSDGDGLLDADERGDNEEPRKFGEKYEFQTADIDGDGLLDGDEVVCKIAIVCSENETICSGECADLTSNANHCGACGAACPSTAICVDQQCVGNCSDPETACGAECFDLTSDVHHCGDCANECETNEVCVDSACQASEVSCDSEETNKDLCWDVCVDLQSDASNCGTCGKVCDSGLSCVNGECVFECSDSSLTACDNSVCADLTSDPRHCGDCSTVCAATDICTDSACAPAEVSCEAEESKKDVCWGSCVDFQTDTQNCGTCGNACTSTQTCQAGACTDPVVPDPNFKYVESKYTKDTDGDGYEDAIEALSASYKGVSADVYICDPAKGAKKTDVNDENGAFEFFFILPYGDPAQNDNLNFKPAVSKLDVVFNMDTTKSMGPEVDNLKGRINDGSNGIIAQIKQRVSDSAFGVSRFDDFPTRPTPNSSYDYLSGNAVEDGGYGRVDDCPTGTETQPDLKVPFRCDVPFRLLGQPETDAGTVQANVNKLGLHHGGDFPESGYEALWQLVMGDDKTKAQARWYRYGSYSVFADGSLSYTAKTANRWGGAQFRNASLPVVIHITDTTSHDTAKNCGDKANETCKPYDPIYVENAHYSDAVHKAYVNKGARIISVYDDRDHGVGNQLQQLVATSSATQAVVPACAFKKDDGSWKCGDNKCCTIASGGGVAPNGDGKCVLSYGIKDAKDLSTTLVDGVDALVKYATSDVAAIIKRDEKEYNETGIDTSCFIKSVMALDDGYVPPPQPPEKECNPKAIPAKFNADYPNGYTNFAIGTSNSAKPGAQLNFKVTAQNDVCVEPTDNNQIFEAIIELIDPKTGMSYGERKVSIIVPGKDQIIVN